MYLPQVNQHLVWPCKHQINFHASVTTFPKITAFSLSSTISAISHPPHPHHFEQRYLSSGFNFEAAIKLSHEGSSSLALHTLYIALLIFLSPGAIIRKDMVRFLQLYNQSLPIILIQSLPITMLQLKTHVTGMTA